MPAAGFSGLVYRVVKPGYPPLSTDGSRKAGRRFNPPGEFGALYCSLKPPTANAEVAHNLRARGAKPEQESDWWEYTIRVQLHRVLDLTNSSVRSALSLESAVLFPRDQGATQALARKIREAGFQAIIVPSAVTPSEKNLVVFDDALQGLQVLSSKPAHLVSG